MSELRFDGRVVLVTGAGGGLGKAYALFFASRGASVVVNDLGGSHTGAGASASAADKVVEEIRAAGGTAVANYDSVEDGEKIVETALKAFGRIDVIINNAGILRDKSFSRMTDDDWDLIMKVHVRGSYKVTKAAWEHMQKQGYGRIINTASAAGLYGNFGQVNYAAAKLALHGFTLTLAREGAKKGITCNTIAPMAASRMTETVLPPEVLASLKPDFVVPLVASLVHETSTETGSVFEVGAGFIAKLRRERTRGAIFKTDSSFTPGAVAARWKDISDFTNPVYPVNMADTDWLGHLEEAQKLQPNPTVGDLRFDGRVAVITGAGGGLGRAYAHLFSRLGAKVVVNDLGGNHTGAGASSSAADKVVEEIRALGGEAVANYDSVEDGEKVIETAIKAFGRVDILVNNAGILRDKSFQRMSDQDWDLIHKVHLRGMYKVTKAAWPHFYNQKYGRIINTASAVGIYGNFGQANYSAAKAGTIAFSNSLAWEGRSKNIIVNTIAPNAGTRMTATVMPPEFVEALKPDYVAPLVAFLAHESNKDTAGLFEVGSGWISRLRWQRSGGVTFPVNVPLLPEAIHTRMADISNYEDGRASYPTTTGEALEAIMANFGNTAEESSAPPVKDGNINVVAAQKAVFKDHRFEFTERDVILYALGVGAKRTDLPLVYENSENFVALPTYGVIPAFAAQVQAVPFGDYLPDFNPMMLLHGEQYLELKKPLPTAGVLTSRGRIIDILDKGKGATVVIGVTTKDSSGEVVLENEFTLFIRGLGGKGGNTKQTDRGAATALNDPPKRAPDAIVREKTSEDLAALYRLSGDLNPLHIDPEMSKMGGFEIPILHGLASFGIAGKHIFQKYCNNNPKNFKSIKVRFNKPVLPGQTLETHMWKEGTKIIFQVKVAETGDIAVSNAAVEISAAAAAAAPVPTPTAAPAFKSAKIFEAINSSLAGLTPPMRKRTASAVKAVFQFDVQGSNGESKSWTVDLKTGDGVIKEGPFSGKADMILTLGDADLVDLALGKANAQKLFTAGKIKIKGNVGLASKLEGVLKLAKTKL
ncbi:hypothetical protein BJ742DRAFT_821479, partial [Cladochytrium replicatum]